MTQSKKYKSYGVRRENNLSDLENREEALNNLLDNIPGVDAENGITFISQDLDAIRGLKDTDITSDDFIQLAGTTVNGIELDQSGNVVVDEDGNTISVPVNPLIRMSDSFQRYRRVTEEPPVFASGRGPNVFFVPSNLLPPSFSKGSNLNTQLVPNLSDPLIQTSNDFWALGEFHINDRIRADFPDEYGGILWDGYYIPNPAATFHTFFYETTGLFHIEFDRFGDNNWEVLKSIYAKQRTVIVLTAATDSTAITLEPNETKYVSVGDFLVADPEVIITTISGNVITLAKAITVSAGQSLVFDMDLGKTSTTGQYTINEILDRGETPQIRKRIFWWFPDSGGYSPDFKYLRNRISGRTIYEYFFLNNERASIIPKVGGARELLAKALTPSQDVMNAQFKSTKTTSSVYEPKPFLSNVTRASINVSFEFGTRSITSTNPALSNTELGNFIVPTAVSDFGVAVPKNMRLKDLLGSNDAANSRLVNTVWPDTKTNYPVSFIDHNGLVDYFVVSSSGNLVTILSGGTTENLKKDMYCVYNNTNQFVRITSIVSPTTFRTSSDLLLTNSYVYVYANAGIIDRSLDVFCVGVFGQTLAATATAGTNTLQLTSGTGVSPGMIVQFAGSIQEPTSVFSVAPDGVTITLTSNLLTDILSGSTIVFAPAGTPVNKEICVIPLDLSPPFVGVDTGLDTNGKGIKSSIGQTALNVKVNTIDMTASVSSATTSESYDRKIDLGGTTLSLIAKKV